MPKNLDRLPENLPVPIDDGACAHLINQKIPPIYLPSTAGRDICLATIAQRTVLYCYPLTGRPDLQLPQGWDQIPGARGCTVEACAFRSAYHELQVLQTQVFGLSTQTTTYQQEAVERLHLPFELLSDANLALTKALHLPTFEVDSMILVKRLTLVLSSLGQIEKVFYPVFPPAQHADEVITWLSGKPL
ncbi:MAG: peroxiredoxin [Chroococcidiopsidaceae cyanobacterium CP_BM_ER_R8_30]|nr:peroxiredoxin [Chroococcidiopsidaceae cyanobacterium CP_BM_ER_R8_30]